MRWMIWLFFSGCALAAQQPHKRSEPAAEQTVIRAVAQEVVLDLIVRDKKGKLVLDLKPQEIEVYEDGVPQKITAFRLVTGPDVARPGSKGTSSGGPKQLDPTHQLRLVTLAYEGLDNEARRLARQASLDLLKNDLEENLYVAVFVIGEQLRVLQPFTNDLALLRKAVERATTSHYPQFVAESEAIRKQLEAVQGESKAVAEATTTNLPGRGQSGSSGIAASSMNARFAQMTLNMLNLEENLTRTQQARSSLFSLLSLVKEQSILPGRKTLIYFTRGLQVPENMVEHLNSTIGAANRAGVSIYGVDARGLALDNQNASSLSMLESAASASRRQQTNPDESVTPEQVKAFDTALSSIHANTQQTLGNLSSSTGGFLVANTNDLREPLRRIHEDVLTYYEIFYAPQISEYDGRFRKVLVKVSRSDVKVQSRSGYFALPPNQDSVFAYEAPLFHALNLDPLPKAFSYHAAVLRFRKQEDKQEHSLVVEVPLKELTAIEDKQNRQYRTRLSVLALLKNERGEIVDRFSRDFPFAVLGDKLDEFRKRNFLQTYPLHLPPGRYTLESTVLDREGQKASARRVSVVVLPPHPGVGLSSLSLVRRMEPQSPETSAASPFYFQQNQVVPTLDNSIQALLGGGFSFYFVVYPLASDAEKPQVTMELSKDGASIGIVSPQLPAANERGEIPYIASFPLANFQPGQYELRVVVRQGASATQERTSFTINP
jgi:VWFA-related protein